MQYKQFRVFPITTIDGIRPITEGLAIECQCFDKDGYDNSYVVIAFVRPDKDGDCSYESVGDRIEEYCPTWEDVQIFRMCLDIAKKEIKETWEGKYIDVR